MELKLRPEKIESLIKRMRCKAHFYLKDIKKIDPRYRIHSILYCTWFDTNNAVIILYIYLYIFTNPSARAGYDTRSIF